MEREREREEGRESEMRGQECRIVAPLACALAFVTLVFPALPYPPLANPFSPS